MINKCIVHCIVRNLLKFSPLLIVTFIIVKVRIQNFNNSKHMQLELFDYRRDRLFDSENQIAHYYDILKETSDSISYSEHIDPKKGYAICGMEYEEYVDVKKDKLGGLTYDQILSYLKDTKKEDRLKKYKALLKFRNIPFESDLFTWHNDDLN